jgi:hypothetical protein
MQLFIAVVWYILVLLTSPTSVSNDKKADKAEVNKTESVKEDENLTVKPRESKVVVWEEEDSAKPISE